MERIACFTGHRPQSLPFGTREWDIRCVLLKRRMKREILRTIQEDGVTHFITGMALGIDQYAAEIVLELKKHHPEIVLEAAIPCSVQHIRWTPEQQQRYQKILSACDLCTVLQERYSTGCMQRRNRYMVDKSSILIAVWNGNPGGTGSTVLYAQSRGKEVRILDPTK